MGGWQQWDEVERLLPAGKVYLDTAFSMSYLGERRFCRLVEAFGAERVLFGSDGPWGDVTSEVARLRGMPLPDDDLEAILWRNAARLLGMPAVSEQRMEESFRLRTSLADRWCHTSRCTAHQRRPPTDPADRRVAAPTGSD